MSLNGLDSPEVQAAYQTVVAEAAGWFLLQYVSRDGVELLARGRNGVSEARNAIAAYTQPSPLYGLMIYRRRRLLIKYIPEDTSRLLQARTSVHFQDILERYSPYETLLEITTADSLNDTALAKTFQLHTASPSPSVGRLDEITEDGEDASTEIGSLASANVSSSSLTAAQRYKAARRGDNLSKRAERLQVSGATPPSLSPHLSPLAAPLESGSVHSPERKTVESATAAGFKPVTITDIPSSNLTTENEHSAAPPETTELLNTAARRLTDETTQEADVAGVQKNSSEISDVPALNRTLVLSTPAPQPSRGEEAEISFPEDSTMAEATPSLRGVSMDDDPYDLSKYDKYFKPKVKLGPRPVTSAERAMRPARVSAVPASFRQARKQEPLRPQSQGQADTTPTTTASAQSQSTMRVPPPIPVEYSPRPYSRGSVKSAPSHRSTAMTPDRLRLMKAVELRKRQLRKSQQSSSFTPPAEDDTPEMPSILVHTFSDPVTTTIKKQAQHQDEEDEQSQIENEIHPQSNKVDSGIEIRYDTPSLDDVDEQAPPIPENTVVYHNQPSAIDKQPVSALTMAAGEATDEDNGCDSPKPTTTLADSQAAESTIAPRQEDEECVESGIPSVEVADRSRSPAAAGDAPIEASVLAHTTSSDTPPSVDPASRPASSDLSRRRRGLVEPLQISMPLGNPDDFMSDDEFLEELHSATVQEARPILFAQQPSMEDMASARSVSIKRNMSDHQSSAEHLSAESSPALRSTSSSEKVDSAWNAPRKVSSGISRRIQALNELSAREANASGHSRPSSPMSTESANNSFLRGDQNSRGPRGIPSPSARPVSFRRPNKTSSTAQNLTSASAAKDAPSWNVQRGPLTSRNSVSVTARIVRAGTEPDQAQLMQSELTINGNRNPAPQPIDVDAAQHSNISSPALSPSSRGSADTRTLHSASGRFGRRGKTLTSPGTPEMNDFPAPPNQRVSTASINTENSTSKAGTRTSRFFKRVSTFSGPKRRRSEQSALDPASVASLESGTGMQMASRVSIATQHSDMPPAVVVGDLNVQFPDSLLWKRRIVTINDHGELQFAIAHAMEIHKGVALRSFSLHQFNAPYAPDLDRQELTNSVVLELQDGTTLQLACEDAMTQRQVLHLLKNYWKSWAAI